ncbi:MarR family winged helix-turn-helix transcriptional regulator [Lactiplantibacillus modestisalitolerans]|uniref:MarR family winged helix-turn-helix transcriptional regulator n=1 Tax=Lactiplantibacillus modestisalitolerans TaxID=1457219 RepID=A0ABV5WRI3_9LACO|nr:MarR family transcriptional regulator [Lactiplantibacillus modestisalitolerans]
MDHEAMVAREVLVLARKITCRRNRHLRQLDLTIEQADALIYFGDHPQQSMAAFKTVQQITHQTARLIIQRLVKRKLLVLTADPNDGRSKRVALTAAGQSKREQLRQHGWQTSAALFKQFTPVQQQTFLALLKLANQSLESSED